MMAASFTCPACEQEDVATEEFDSEEDMETHIRAVHLKWTPFQCFYCSKKAAGPHNLKKHAAIQHFGETFKVIFQPEMKKIAQLEAIRSENGGNDRNKSYACLRCEEEENVATDFDSRSQLLAHIREIHLKVRPFSCQYCSLSSACWTNLRNHIRSRHIGAEQKIIITPNENMDMAVERIVQGFESSESRGTGSVQKFEIPPSGIIPQTTSTPYSMPSQRYPMPIPYSLSSVKVENFYANNRYPDGMYQQHGYGAYNGTPVSSLNENTESSQFSRNETESVTESSTNLEKQPKRLLSRKRVDSPEIEQVSTHSKCTVPPKRSRIESDPADDDALQSCGEKKAESTNQPPGKSASEKLETPNSDESQTSLGNFITTCRLCGFHKDSLRYKSRRLLHIYQKHLSRRDFVRCPLCTYSCPDSRSMVLTHIKNKHPDEMDTVEPIDDRGKYRKQAEKLEKTCFGSRPQPKKSRSKEINDENIESQAPTGTENKETNTMASRNRDTDSPRNDFTAEQSGSDSENTLQDTIECLLCHKAIERNSESMTYHVQSTHFQGKRIDCPVESCQFSTTNYNGIKGHIGKKHKRSNVVAPSKEDFNETNELEKLYNTCFPRALPPQPTVVEAPVKSCTVKEEKMPRNCLLCNESIRDQKEHVIQTHFTKKLIHCVADGCSFGISTMNNLWCLKQHFRNIHTELTEFSYIDKRQKYQREIEKLTQRCFPLSQEVPDSSDDVDPDFDADQNSPIKSQNSAQSEQEEAEEEGKEQKASRNKPKRLSDTRGRRFCKLCQMLVHRDRRSHCYNYHLGVQTVLCPVDGCKYGSKFNVHDVKRHIARSHPEGQSLQPIDNRKDHADEVQRKMVEAFPDETIINVEPTPRVGKALVKIAQKTESAATERVCQICNVTVKNGKYSIHIWRSHMDLPVLQCRHCEFHLTHNDKHRYYQIHGVKVHPNVEDPEPINQARTPRVATRFEELYQSAYKIPFSKKVCLESQNDDQAPEVSAQDSFKDNEEIHETTETGEGIEEQLAEISRSEERESNESDDL